MGTEAKIDSMRTILGEPSLTCSLSVVEFYGRLKFILTMTEKGLRTVVTTGKLIGNQVI